jgi:hypothetical protein
MLDLSKQVFCDTITSSSAGRRILPLPTNDGEQRHSQLNVLPHLLVQSWACGTNAIAMAAEAAQKMEANQKPQL